MTSPLTEVHTSGSLAANFTTVFREVCGQFSGRSSGTPNTTNEEVWRFLTIFRTTFRSVFQSTSGRISRHLPGRSLSKPDQEPSRLLEQSQANGCSRNAIYPLKPSLGAPCCTCKNLPQFVFEETLTMCWSCPGCWVTSLLAEFGAK